MSKSEYSANNEMAEAIRDLSLKAWKRNHEAYERSIEKAKQTGDKNDPSTWELL